MPELPDVEAYRRFAGTHVVRQTIRRVRVYDRGVLHDVTPGSLGKALHGKEFRRPDRRGKWLLLPTTSATVMLHFGMTGQLHWCGSGAVRHRHDRVGFVTDKGELRYRDMRKLRGLWLARDADELSQVTGPLGPDAMRISGRAFRDRLAGRRGALKPTLIDQTVIAGLGNLLVDEILWQARLRPAAPVPEASAADLAELYDDMRRVLRVTVKAGRVPPRSGWLTGVRDGSAAACPRCRHRVREDKVGGRRTVWCPRCQC